MKMILMLSYCCIMESRKIRKQASFASSSNKMRTTRFYLKPVISVFRRKSLTKRLLLHYFQQKCVVVSCTGRMNEE